MSKYYCTTFYARNVWHMVTQVKSWLPKLCNWTLMHCLSLSPHVCLSLPMIPVPSAITVTKKAGIGGFISGVCTYWWQGYMSMSHKVKGIISFLTTVHSGCFYIWLQVCDFTRPDTLHLSLVTSSGAVIWCVLMYSIWVLPGKARKPKRSVDTVLHIFSWTKDRNRRKASSFCKVGNEYLQKLTWYICN